MSQKHKSMFKIPCCVWIGWCADRWRNIRRNSSRVSFVLC